MKSLRTWRSVAALLVLLLGISLPAAAQTPVPGRIEWTITDENAPYIEAVLPATGSPWFGPAGARVYLSYDRVQNFATIYLPPAGCQITPTKECASVCPPEFSCYLAKSTYRITQPGERVPVLVLDTVPFYAGQPGDVAHLYDRGDGTVRWYLP